MAIRDMRLALGLFFLAAGAVLLGLRFGMPDAVARLDPTRLFLGGLLALALGCWNLTKWYAAWAWYQQRATPVRRPLQPDTTADEDPVLRPEFDFSQSKPDGADTPTRS